MSRTRSPTATRLTDALYRYFSPMRNRYGGHSYGIRVVDIPADILSELLAKDLAVLSYTDKVGDRWVSITKKGCSYRRRNCAGLNFYYPVEGEPSRCW